MRKFTWLYLLLLLGALGWGFASILELRFGGGDIYPAGSSLRMDRQGTRVLYESLARLRPVSQNFTTLEGQDLRQVTILMLNLNVTQVEDSNWKTLTGRGARVVLAFAPAAIQRKNRELQDLDLELTYSAPTEEMQDTPAWEGSRNTTLRLVPHSAQWAIIQKGEVIERPMGRGSLVIAANADRFSNQTLAEQREPELLTRVIGAADRVIFEETHFGVRDAPGVMVLVRRFGLVGLVLALLVLAGLFVWQAAFPLVPLPAEGHSQNSALVSHRTAESGLAQLLRRGIPPHELIPACARQWERLANATPKQREAVRLALHEANHPVAAYARATLALERKR